MLAVNKKILLFENFYDIKNTFLYFFWAEILLLSFV